MDDISVLVKFQPNPTIPRPNELRISVMSPISHIGTSLLDFVDLKNSYICICIKLVFMQRFIPFRHSLDSMGLVFVFGPIKPYRRVVVGFSRF